MPFAFAFGFEVRARPALFLAAIAAAAACSTTGAFADELQERWLAGDHHVHSRYSVFYDENNLPAYSFGGDAIYPIPMNALMARHFGLDWMVATDHGGPNHSKINFELAYPELRLSRNVIPEIVQFYGLELNTPAADHSSIIMPYTPDESAVLRDLESRFDKYEKRHEEQTASRDQEDLMIEALRAMDRLEHKPVVIANHPARLAPHLGEFKATQPRELRNWNDTAPEIAVGMEGAPGHQAGPLRSKDPAPRGWYFGFPTMGGYDQMTSQLGGVWDALLGEGRRWWITANSDAHEHYTEGAGVNFWPGEYAKTYIYARKSHSSILEGLRAGRVFVTTGDLITELYVDVIDTAGGSGAASIGGTVTLSRAGEVSVRILAKDPRGTNHNGDSPQVRRIDLIIGAVTGPDEKIALDVNRSTFVGKRFSAADWQRDGETISMSYTLDVSEPTYVRVRGTNTDELEPVIDPPDENPWSDLWFYSNPVFIEIRN